MNVLQKTVNIEPGTQKFGQIQTNILWSNSIHTKQPSDSNLVCLITFKPRKIMPLHQNKHSHLFNTYGIHYKLMNWHSGLHISLKWTWFVLVYTRETDNFLVHCQNQVSSLESYTTVLTKIISPSLTSHVTPFNNNANCHGHHSLIVHLMIKHTTKNILYVHAMYQFHK